MVEDPDQSSKTQLYRRINLLRWIALPAGFLTILAHQFLERFIEVNKLPQWEFVELIYGFLIIGTIWFVLTLLSRSIKQNETANLALNQAHLEASEANQRLEFLLQVNRRLSAAEDDVELAEAIISQTMEVSPSVACSLVRFDANQQALPTAIRIGLGSIKFDDCVTHLPVKEIRQQCRLCSQHWPEGPTTCSLQVQQLPVEDVQHIHCLELTRGNDQLYGVLSLYLADATYPNEPERRLLEMMAAEMAMALESNALRFRELEVLNRIQNARRLINLQDELAGVMADTVEVLQVDGGLLFLADGDSAELELKAEAGLPLEEAKCLVADLATGASRAETPLIIRDLEQVDSNRRCSLLIAPLRSGERLFGSLVLWTSQPDLYTRRRTQLVATVASQAALLVENHHLYLRGEYRAALAERARLAREIHDGLAQTLGYLKLRTTQISSQLEHGELKLAKSGLIEVQRLLSEAYLDAREAIDGLRLDGRNDDLSAWVEEIVSEFEALSQIPVRVDPVPNVTLPVEIHAQLQRIVQEALSNIRKHADATQAWVVFGLGDDWLTVQIRDNGCGFDPADVPPAARHGLSIMRERADLLDADFQLTSVKDSGTHITVRLPFAKEAFEVHYE